MPVPYKVIQRGEPGVPGGGTKKYYARSVSKGVKDIDDLTQSIEKISTVSGADIRAVLYSLVDVISGHLSDGYIVRLGDLGSMRISISSDGFDTAEEVNNNAIRRAKILFSPESKLQNTLATLRYKKNQ